MKKTAQTLLTAAMFATALGSSAGAAPAENKTAFAIDDEYLTTTMTEALYGPPWVLSSIEEERQKTASTTETVTQTVTEAVTTADMYFQTTEPVPLYGPPWVLFPDGDANMDRVHDARDLTLIKRAALEGENANYMLYRLADVNGDGVVDKEDISMFKKHSLGILEENKPAVTTAPDVQEELETTTRTTAVLLYGPPSMME